MPNTEWYKETEPDYDASGRWWADGYNEALSLGLSYGDDGVDVNFIDQLLAHHRELIVKEIRESVLKRLKDDMENDIFSPLRGEDNSHARMGYLYALDVILALPCLKENE